MTMQHEHDSPRVDNALLAALAAGEISAITDLYDRHAATLLAVGLRILRDRTDAEDVLHDLFVDLPARARSYDSERGTVIAWLVVGMRNRAIDRARRHAWRRANDSKMAKEHALVGAPHPEEEIAGTRRRARVVHVLLQLPLLQRSVLERVFYEGLSYPEIAAQDGVPLGTVKSRAARALATLRRLLSSDADGGAPPVDLSTGVANGADSNHRRASSFRTRRTRFSFEAYAGAALPRS
jgi:RNA polymerase sigma-70 factor (ECF subfamily)